MPKRRKDSRKTPTKPVRAATRRRTGRRKGPSGTWRRALFATVLLGVLVSAAVVVYSYGRLNRIIDARLGQGSPDPSAVYSASLRILQGRPISEDGLIRILEAYGYHPSPHSSEARWYVPTADRVRFGEAGDDRTSAAFFTEGRLSRLLQGERQADHLDLSPVLLGSLNDSSLEKRRKIRFTDIPSHLTAALLAAEDQRFFDHPGLDIFGLLRATLTNLLAGEVRQGGSTLTQQFAKNFFLTPDRTVRRKLEEAFLAVLLERRFTKQEILDLYVNDVYLGQAGGFAIHGFGQAAASYFGKQPSELTLGECALLAGIIQAPNRLSPFRHPDEARARRNQILGLMYRNGAISQAEMAAARAEPIALRPPETMNSAEAPYFIDYVAHLLESSLGIPTSTAGLVVSSTLDPVLQKAAVAAVSEGLEETRRLVSGRNPRPQPEAALVAINPKTGAIMALVGGRDFSNSPFNRATDALRAPGSTFKPFVYAAALESNPGITLSSMIVDEPLQLKFDGKVYAPGNFDGRFRGVVSVRTALAESLNVPTVRLAAEIGFPQLLARIQNFGFKERLQPYPSLALGSFEITPLELASGYQIFANGGVRIDSRAIESVRIGGDPAPTPPPQSNRVMSAETAFLMTSALASVIDEGTGQTVRRLGFELPASGKTGSTTDSWFAGYTSELVCVVWVGTDQPPDLDLTGARAALPIWTRFMHEAQGLGYLSGELPQPPPGIVSVRIDPQSGLRATPGCSAVEEFFREGSEPAESCRDHQFHLAETNQSSSPKGGVFGWLGRLLTGKKP